MDQDSPKLSFWRLNKCPENLQLLSSQDRERVETDPTIHGLTLNHPSPAEEMTLETWSMGQAHLGEYHATSTLDTWRCNANDLPAFHGTARSVWGRLSALNALTEALLLLPKRDSVAILKVRATTREMRSLMLAANAYLLPGDTFYYTPSPRVLSHPSQFDIAPLVEMATRLERLLTMFIGNAARKPEHPNDSRLAFLGELTSQLGLIW